MAEQEPKLLSFNLTIHVLSAAMLLPEIDLFPWCLLTANTVPGTGYKRRRPTGDSLGSCLGRERRRGQQWVGRALNFHAGVTLCKGRGSGRSLRPTQF